MTDRPGMAVGGVGTMRRHRGCEIPPAPSEHELLADVRSGRGDAFGEIYELHRPSVERLARRLCRDPQEADDVVSEVFCNALQAIRNGHGPRTEARAYLLRSVRHTVIKLRTRKDTGRATVCASEQLDRVATDESDRGGPATDALADVSPRLREVLWQVEIVGFDTRRVAEDEAIAPPAAASLVYRARRSLRRAYLRGCIRTPSASAACDPIRALLPGFVDGETATAGADRVRDHLAGCDACGRALDEVISVHDRFAASSWVLLLPALFRSLVSSVGHSAATAGTSSLLVLATVGAAGVALPGDTAGDVATPPSLDATTTTVRSGDAPPGVVAVVVAPEPADVEIGSAIADPSHHHALPIAPDRGSDPAAPPTDDPVSSVAVPDQTDRADSPVEDVVHDAATVAIEDVVGAVGTVVDQTAQIVVGGVDGVVEEATDLLDRTGDAVIGDAGVVRAVVDDVPIVDETVDLVDDAVDGVLTDVEAVTGRLLDGLDRLTSVP